MAFINLFAFFHLCLWSNTAPAEEISSRRQSERQHQAESKILEITPGLQFAREITKTKPSSGVSESEIVLFSASTAVEYGLNHLFSIGSSWRYGWLWNDRPAVSTSQDYHSVGWYDPTIFAKGKLDRAGPGSLRIEMSLAKSLGDNTDANHYSGGTSVQPSLGYELQLTNQIAGIRFDYQAFTGGRNYAPEDEFEYKIEGGNRFTSTLFYELHRAPYIWGLAFQVINTASSKITAESAAALQVNLANGLGKTVDNSSSSSLYKLEAYVPIDLSPSLRLLPRASYNAAGAFDSVAVRSSSSWAVDCSARWEL